MQAKAQIDPDYVENREDESRVDVGPRADVRPRAMISVGDGLYLLVMTAAAVMRFTALDQIPLSPAEAAEALAAWQFSQPEALTMSAGSPAYFTLTSLLVPFLGANDTVMRLVPAAFGLALIALPWLLRKRIGIIGALASASLLAASPLNSAVSRTAGGDAIALFAVLLAIVAVARLNGPQKKRWFYTLSIALGLGLCSSPLFFSGLATGLLAVWLTRWTTKQDPGIRFPERTTILRGVILGLLVLVGLSTRFLTYPAGLGASARLLGEWLGQFGFGSGLQGLAAPFLVLARYEIALLVLGTAAFFWVIWKGNTTSTFYLLWLLAGLGLLFLQSGTLSNVLPVTVAGYLLVGLAANLLLQRGINGWTWALMAFLILIGAVLLVNATRYLRVSLYEEGLSNIWLSILALAAAVLIIYYTWVMTDARIGQGIWLALFLLLLTYEWGTAWHLTHRAANDPRESWVAQGTDNDVPLLVDMLRDISRQATNSDGDLALISGVDTPVLRWYLRDFRRAIIGESLPPQAQQQVVISALGNVEPRLGSDYVGSDYGLLRKGTSAPPESSTPLSDLLRWLLFHETAAQMIEDRVIVWVRADLVAPEQ